MDASKGEIRCSNLLTWVIVVLMITLAGCRKSETPAPQVPEVTAPVFTVSHTFISVGGNDYIQFMTCCTSENVKLSGVAITDPQNKHSSYEYYSDTTGYQVFLKNENFTFPEDFSRQSGIWKFTYTGKRFKDDSDFVTTVNDTVVKK